MCLFVQGGKRTPNLGTSAYMGSDYYSDSSIGGTPTGWRKYSLPQTNKLLSSDPGDYSYPYSIGGWTTRSDQQEYSAYRKLSTASHPEFSPQVDSGYGDTFARGVTGEHAPSPAPGTKRDCETNTDQSHLMDASLRQRHAVRASNMHGGTPPSQGGGSMFGYRRPLSNTSTSSMGSGKSSGSSVKGSPVVGSRLARHGMEGVPQMVRSGSDSVTHLPTGIPRPASTSSARSCHSDMSDGYGTTTSDRRQRIGLTPSKSTGAAAAAAQADFQSNSLGRRRLFSSKGNLSQRSMDGHDSATISNPHATYTKDGAIRNLSHYVNLQELHGRQQQHSNYVPLEFPSQRHSGGSATGVALGPSLWHRNSQGSIPPPAPPGQDVESMDLLDVSTSSALQLQLQQACTMSGVSAHVLQQHREVYAALSAAAQPSPCPSPTPMPSAVLHRSSSASSDRSGSSINDKDAVLSSHMHSDSLSDLSDSSKVCPSPSPPCPSTPTQASRFACGVPPSEVSGEVGMVRSSTQPGVPNSAASLSKSLQGKEDEGSRKSLDLPVKICICWCGVAV